MRIYARLLSRKVDFINLFEKKLWFLSHIPAAGFYDEGNCAPGYVSFFA